MLDLTGKNAFITGIANNRSIAWGIAQQLHQAGANIGVNYLPDDKGRFEKKVTELVQPLNPSLIVPCDVQNDELLDSMFASIEEKWGKLDILVHCLAFADRADLTGDFSATSRAGFAKALDISSYSLNCLAVRAKPLMKEGGSIVTLSYLGGVKVIPNYNVMGVAKSALEMSVRYLAAELGQDNSTISIVDGRKGPCREHVPAMVRNRAGRGGGGRQDDCGQAQADRRQPRGAVYARRRTRRANASTTNRNCMTGLGG